MRGTEPVRRADDLAEAPWPAGCRNRKLVDAMRAGRPRGLVGITFDDGYVSVLEAALPELQRHGFTATMYIVSGRLGGSNDWDEGPRWPLMSAGQIGELAAAGMEIGSHRRHARAVGRHRRRPA